MKTKGFKKNKITEEVLKKYPKPTLNIVSLASEESLQAFVDRFDKLKILSINLIKPNNEINNDGLFNGLRDQGNKLHATTASLSYKNPQGLLKQTVKNHAENALDGNSEVALSGTDSEGRKLSGSNEDFKIQVSVDGIPKAIKQAAQKIYDVFSRYKKLGKLKTGNQTSTIEKEAKLIRLAQLFSAKSDSNA